jgi:hypothetical protein
MSPYRLRTGKEHTINIMVPFGCLATVYIKPIKRGGKLRPAADVGIFLGHGERSDGGLQGFRVYKYATNKVVIRHDVDFNPTLPAMKYITTVAATATDSQFVNRTITKTFGNNQHTGIVHSHRKDNDGLTLWAIRYDDKDWEELHLAEMLAHINPTKAQITASTKHTRLQQTPSMPVTTTTPEPPAPTTKTTPSLSAPSKRYSKRKRKQTKITNMDAHGESDPSKHKTYNHDYRLTGSRAVKAATIYHKQPPELNAAHPNLPPKETITDVTQAKTIPNPKTHRQASRSPHRDYWTAAEEAEIKSLIAKEVWTVERPTHPVTSG